MDPTTLVLAAVVVTILVAFILAEQPIWLALASSGGLGLIILDGPRVAARTVGGEAFSATSSYALVVIPMFIMMGVFAAKAGVATDIFRVAARGLSRIPGGLGVATIGACGGFAAVTGSSVATVATVGKIAIDELRDKGYKPDAAAAIVAAGGTLGVLIPPSVILVVFASLTGQSVGRLLLAGFIPGAVTIVVYSATVLLLYNRGSFRQETPRVRVTTLAASHPMQIESNGSSESSDRDAAPETGEFSESQKNVIGLGAREVFGTLYVAGLFTIVLGGIYSGVFTATESGAVAAAAAMLIAIWRYRRRGGVTTMRAFGSGLRETASLSTMIFALLAGGAVFSFFLVKTGIPNYLSRRIVEMGINPLWMVLLTLAFMVVLGFFLDSYSILVITIPLVWPIMQGVGVDGIWLGILVVKAIEIGLITPPFGINAFVITSISTSLALERVFRMLIPFVFAEFVVIGILIIFPDLVTWLPNQVYG